MKDDRRQSGGENKSGCRTEAEAIFEAPIVLAHEMRSLGVTRTRANAVALLNRVAGLSVALVSIGIGTAAFPAGRYKLTDEADAFREVGGRVCEVGFRPGD